MKYLIRISFVGTNYCGFQSQKNSRSIQEVLTNSMSELFGCPVDVSGCSRTDSGVHANDFCISVSPKSKNFAAVPPEKISRAACAILPSDIAVNSAEIVPDSFHVRYDVSQKEYLYKIWNRAENNPFLFGLAMKYPQYIDDNAVMRMNRAGEYIVGSHDFRAFMAQGSRIENTVRTVKHCVTKRQGDIIEIRISADGFLYNMVRIISGTLLCVAEGKITPDEIPDIIKSGDRRRAGATLPACGLYLNSVEYK